MKAVLIKLLIQIVESQSPQIGSMFLTREVICESLLDLKKVAIPSNRVNVSYIKKEVDQKHQLMSQSPQIGSMFLTLMLVVISKQMR